MTKTILTLAAIVSTVLISSAVQAGGCSSGSRISYPRYVSPAPKVRLIDDHGHCPAERPIGREPLRLGFYGELISKGMLVNDIQRRSLADEIGLEEGDIIRAVDGIRIRREIDWDEAMIEARGMLWLQVIRCDCGKIEDLRIELQPIGAPRTAMR